MPNLVSGPSKNLHLPIFQTLFHIYFFLFVGIFLVISRTWQQLTRSTRYNNPNDLIVCVCICVCECLCVWMREREREWERRDKIYILHIDDRKINHLMEYSTEPFLVGIRCTEKAWPKSELRWGPRDLPALRLRDNNIQRVSRTNEWRDGCVNEYCWMEVYICGRVVWSSTYQHANLFTYLRLVYLQYVSNSSTVHYIYISLHIFLFIV